MAYSIVYGVITFPGTLSGVMYFPGILSGVILYPGDFIDGLYSIVVNIVLTPHMLLKGIINAMQRIGMNL